MFEHCIRAGAGNFFLGSYSLIVCLYRKPCESEQKYKSNSYKKDRNNSIVIIILLKFTFYLLQISQLFSLILIKGFLVDFDAFKKQENKVILTDEK